MRYSLKDAQKRFYYSGLKLNSNEINLYAAGIMVIFLCGIYLY